MTLETDQERSRVEEEIKTYLSILEKEHLLIPELSPLQFERAISLARVLTETRKIKDRRKREIAGIQGFTLYKDLIGVNPDTGEANITGKIVATYIMNRFGPPTPKTP